MANFVFSPNWFYGPDILIEIFSMITLFLIAYFSYRFYRLNTEKKEHLYLGMAFVTLSVSFLAKIMTYVVIYYYKLLQIDQVAVVQQVLSNEVIGMRPSYFMFSAGVAMFSFLQLVGLYMLTCIYQKRISRYDTLIILYAFFMITYFSHNTYFAFHLTSLLLLSIISYIFFRTYRKNRHPNTKRLMSAFLIIAISQAVYMFKTLNPAFYVWGEVIQLVGYFLLLLTIIMVIKHGKKKK